MRNSLYRLIVIDIILALIFYFYPEIDLVTSRIFYDNKFYLQEHYLILFLDYARYLLLIILIGLGAYCCIKVFRHTRSLHLRSYINLIYIFIASLLGPFAIVHIAKHVFGRARPFQIIEFGGELQFSPAFTIAGQCMEDCSFISGHAATGFILFIFGFAYASEYRNMWHISAIIAGLLLGLGRIISGYHFLSDVVFSGVVVYSIAYWLSTVMLGEVSGNKDNKK